MGKKNTVQIDMEVFDGWLKKSSYKSPKEFCEKELGLSDGWYYGIRKNNGKGVKTLLAMLIADKMGIHIDELLYLEKPKETTPIIEDPIQTAAGGISLLADSVRKIFLNAEKMTELFACICLALEDIVEQLESQEA
jgi:hypothetical protein